MHRKEVAERLVVAAHTEYAVEREESSIVVGDDWFIGNEADPVVKKQLLHVFVVGCPVYHLRRVLEDAGPQLAQLRLVPIFLYPCLVVHDEEVDQL